MADDLRYLLLSTHAACCIQNAACPHDTPAFKHNTDTSHILPPHLMDLETRVQHAAPMQPLASSCTTSIIHAGCCLPAWQSFAPLQRPQPCTMVSPRALVISRWPTKALVSHEW